MENKEEIYTALEGKILAWFMELEYNCVVLAQRILLCEICCRILPVTEWRGARNFGRISQSSCCFRHYSVCFPLFLLTLLVLLNKDICVIEKPL